MEEKEIGDYLWALRRYRYQFAAILLGLLILVAFATLLWPAVYRSTAVILIEEQEIPPDLVRSTITSYAAQRLQTINQRVMTRSNLLAIIDKYDLYAKRRKRETTEELLERMRDDIAFQTISADVIDPRSGHPTTATIAFSLSFDGSEPALTQKVTNEITNLYLEENLRNRTQKTAEATDFLRDEMEQVGAAAADIEHRLATFKAAHIDELPEQKPLITQSMERIEAELKAIELQLRATQERNYLIDSQLAIIPPESPGLAGGIGADRFVSPTDRLKFLRTEAIGLAARYSEKHPDVVKLRQEIAALERKTGDVDATLELERELKVLRTERATLADRYSTQHPDVLALERRITALEQDLAEHQRPRRPRGSERLTESAADNPAYLNLLAQKEANNVEIAGLNQRARELRGKFQVDERRLRNTPEVERQYLILLREWENTTTRHRELKAKFLQAQIAEQLERKSKGERFSIVEPPQLPERPIKPNRPLLATVGALLAFALALVYVLLRETLDTSIRRSRQITALTGAPPLAVIPHYDPHDHGPARIRRLLLLTGAAGLALGLVLLLLHLLWIPLDVLWFRGLRKLESMME